MIGGYKPNGSNFESILVGYYDERRLCVAEKVRAGLTPHTRAEIFRRLTPIAVERCPFANLPNSTGRSRWGEGITEADMTSLCWVKTDSGCRGVLCGMDSGRTLRHPAFLGVRDDKESRAVKRE